MIYRRDLRYIFWEAKNKGPPFPQNEPGAEALSYDQLYSLARRFAVEDAGVYIAIKQLYHIDTPLTQPEVQACFAVYLQSIGAASSIDLAPGMPMEIDKDHISGRHRLALLKEAIEVALNCRTELQDAHCNPTSHDAIAALSYFSAAMDKLNSRYLKLTQPQLTLIKNLALPTNAVDHRLHTKTLLGEIYQKEFNTKIAKELGPEWLPPPRKNNNARLHR